MAPPPYLALKNLSCERDGRLLIDNLTLDLELGQILQVEGPNGSGKTTMLKIISTLSPDYSGDIEWRGQPIHKVQPEYLNDVIFLGHAAGIKSILSPLENLRWSASMNMAKTDAEIIRALERVNLAGYEHSPCFSLSAGQQRRVSLAKLFLFDAPLWILDEPFTAIDKQGVHELEVLIGEHADKGGLVILTTHHQFTLERPIRKLSLGGGVA